MLQLNDVSKIQSLVKTTTDYSSLPWKEAWSVGQISSKMWILDELEKIHSTSFECIYVMGGWLGVLSWLLLNDDRFTINKIRSFDIDPECEPAADRLNIDSKINDWKFKAVTADATNMSFSVDGFYDLVALKSTGAYSKPRPERPDCIVNTSCDHFKNLSTWISTLPTTSLLILQNTNVAHDDTHVNCVDNIEDFKAQANLTKLFYAGTLELDNYKRFMIIGYR